MRPPSPRVALLAERCLAALVLALAFFRGLDRVPLHMDESLWIAHSLYLEAALDEGFVPPGWLREEAGRTAPPGAADAAREEWSRSRTFAPHYSTLDQPMLARFLIGLGRRLQGYRVADLNRPWQLGLTPEENEGAGNVPSPGLLLAARRTSALLGVAGGFLLWGLVRQGAGRAAGLVFLLLFAASPYLLTHLRRAMGEPALLFFASLSLWAGARALGAFDPGGETPGGMAMRRTFAWLAAAGAAAGLAGASKLNGLGVAGAGVVLAAALALHPRRPGGLRRRLGLAAAASLVVLSSCAATFVAVNPSLYRRPAAHLSAMLELRSRELAGHRADPRWGLAEPGRRVRVVLGRTLQHYAVVRVAPLNALLGLAGLLALARAARRWAADGSGSPAAAPALLAGALFLAGPALLTPVDWDRYYLFPVVFLTVLLAAGAAALPGALLRLRKGA